MNHDLVIRNGLVVDGTGADPYAADVAVDGNVIVVIGKVTGSGKEEIDAGWATFTLSHWYRTKKIWSLSETIRRLTSAPARVLGLSHRGSIAVGQRADLNVIDIDHVAEYMPQRVEDFPFGAARLIQRAVGYKATVCNGVVILRDDNLTGARAGEILRFPSNDRRLDRDRR